MAGNLDFVVSVLGQDIFYAGRGGVTTDIQSAQIYSTFAQAEAGSLEAAGTIRDYGIAWEIRSVLVGS
jgi:hypothetical protein